MVRPITPPGRIAIDPPKIDSLLKLLKHVNELNMRAKDGERYWTCVVLYNTVVWKQTGSDAVMVEVYDGVLK
ncbi:hypothetical protein P9A28_gp43 [Sphingomonas phage Eidolon]|uniref:Uncharacterized protein n=1 Tax=Sphingomonas phage Eidolon TaxID=2686311 RepID=A0A6M3T9S2_9CAUD|nr:hypothetical protein P9A28_gp43 [Sphingomonas phage Eidolon]QJD54429.1 hypothetical protein [Sphingomonas phage Eidolon]